MIVGGYNQTAVFTRPTSATGVAAAAGADHSMTAAEEARQTNPTYFRSISSISYGSLAGAYQSIRALETSAGAGSERTAANDTASSPAILSGIGIPAALDAYGEAIETSAA